MKAKELMKKVTGGALIAVMAVTMLAGCVSKTETPPADTKTEDSDSKDDGRNAAEVQGRELLRCM